MAIGSARNSGITNTKKYNNVSAAVGEKYPAEIESIVIAGGGSGNAGAGGYRSSVFGELSGGSSARETPLTTSWGPKTVTIGAGGSTGQNGSDSVFDTIVSTGGGRTGQTGGSGGGQFSSSNVPGIAGQGTEGRRGNNNGGYFQGANGGGGGSATTGTNGGSSGGSAYGGNGGAGIISNITGTSVQRGGGGGGGAGAYASRGGSGGAGGGGVGRKDRNTAGHGAANTGSGGGGAGYAGTHGSGGSGVVFLKYPSENTVIFDASHVYTIHDQGAYTVAEITAGDGEVKFF